MRQRNDGGLPQRVSCRHRSTPRRPLHGGGGRSGSVSVVRFYGGGSRGGDRGGGGGCGSAPRQIGGKARAETLVVGGEGEAAAWPQHTVRGGEEVVVKHMTLACLSRGRLREVDVDLFHAPRRQRAAQRGRRVARNHLEVLQPLHRRLRQNEASAVAPQLKRNPASLWLGRRLQHDPVACPRAHLNLHRRSSTRPRRWRRGGGG